MAETIELSKFDELVLQAIIRSIQATYELDKKQNRCFTQAQRIGNFTTFVRRETATFVDTYVRSIGEGKGLSNTDCADLKRWLARLCSTKYWVDIASPDYHGNRYYRSPFRLILSDNLSQIMDVEKMTTLCNLAKEKVKVSSSTSEEEISSDNFQSRLETIIASANQKIAEANSITSQVSTILSNFQAPTP